MSLRIQVKPNDDVYVDEIGGNPNYEEVVNTTIGGFSQDILDKIRNGDYIAKVSVASESIVLNVTPDGTIYVVMVSGSSGLFDFALIQYIGSTFSAISYTCDLNNNTSSSVDVTSLYSQQPCTLTLRYAPIPD